jgi:adenylylsulfate kinase
LTPDIYPVDHQLISRAAREIRLGQHAGVFWFTGLSGSGKSTLALALEKALFAEGFHVVVLDGDTIRTGINNNLGFSSDDRMENIRRIAEVAKLFVQGGIICLVSFISPTRAMRDMARNIIGTADFHDIFVDTPLEVCEARDVKGLYRRARAGEIAAFTGVSAPYEPPVDPFLHLRTEGHAVEASLAALLAAVRPVVRIRTNH